MYIVGDEISGLNLFPRHISSYETVIPDIQEFKLFFESPDNSKYQIWMGRSARFMGFPVIKLKAPLCGTFRQAFRKSPESLQ